MNDEKKISKGSLAPVLITLCCLGFAGAVCLAARAQTTGWGAEQIGPLGTWVASGFTLGAVWVALRQANLAREQATITNEELARQARDSLRREQLEAVTRISNSGITVYGAFVSQDELDDEFEKLCDAGLSEHLSVQYIMQRRTELLMLTNAAVTDARLALVNIVNEALEGIARAAINDLNQAVTIASGASSAEVNWKVALQPLQTMIAKNQQLQGLAESLLSPRTTYAAKFH